LFLLLFAASACWNLRVLATINRPVMTLSAEGIQDLRNGGPLIPWRIISGVSKLNVGDQTKLVFSLHADAEKPVSPRPRWRITPTQIRFVDDSQSVVVSGLNMPARKLLELCHQRIQPDA
jgi:hypothetical protein